VSACGGVKDDAANAAGENSVLVGTTDKVTSLDPAGSYDNGSYAVQIQVFPFLYAQDYNTSELSPDIAADDGTWSKDGKQFTVKIKDGLKFANGHTLDSKDVKFSYDRIDTINDPNGPSSLLANIDSIETPDANTVVFNSKVPFDVTLKQVMSSPAGPIVDDEVFSADKITDADTIVSGKAFAGPYQIDSFKLNEAVSYSKNGNYQGLTPVKNSGVQVKYFADASNLKMAVEQGQVDVAYRSLSPTHIEDLGKNSKVKVVKGPGGEVRMLAFNFKLQPYGESQKDADAAKAKAVRQAVASLIDRDELSQKVYKGTYTPLYSFIPDGLTGHEHAQGLHGQRQAGRRQGQEDALGRRRGHPGGSQAPVQRRPLRFQLGRRIRRHQEPARGRRPVQGRPAADRMDAVQQGACGHRRLRR